MTEQDRADRVGDLPYGLQELGLAGVAASDVVDE
jgi:hypothetical protein